MIKKNWGEGTPWKTESSFFSWIRGGIRRGLWNKSPIKLNFLNKHREQIPNPNPRGKKETVWGARCCQCNNLFPVSQIEVDHKRGQNQLRSIEDISTFIQSIVLVTEDDLQLICKPCHKIKSYAEKQGISFEAANAEKRAIQIINDKADKQTLLEAGITPASNQKARRQQLIKLFNKE